MRIFRILPASSAVQLRTVRSPGGPVRPRSLLAGTVVLAITATAMLAVGSPAQATTDDPAVARTLTAEVQQGEKVRAIIEIERGQNLADVAKTAEAASS